MTAQTPAPASDEKVEPMDDEALAKFLGLHDDPRWPQAVANIPPEKRALYERMHQLCVEVELYSQGLGPRPTGVLMDFDKRAPRTDREAR